MTNFYWICLLFSIITPVLIAVIIILKGKIEEKNLLTIHYENAISMLSEENEFYKQQFNEVKKELKNILGDADE